MPLGESVTAAGFEIVFKSNVCFNFPRTEFCGMLNIAFVVFAQTFPHISNAKMEGFNNKIRWLIKQAYGFRDREYFKLKIYQLPEISSSKEI